MYVSSFCVCKVNLIHFGLDVLHIILVNRSLASFEKQIDKHVTITLFAADKSCMLKKDFSYF